MARRQSIVNRVLIVIVLAFGVLHVLYSGYLLDATSFDKSLHHWNELNDFITHRGAVAIVPPPPPPPIKLKYVGVAGLGHRLIRMSSVYHLARILNVPEIDVMWRGYCPKRYRSKPNIFELLFANGTTVQVPPLQTKDRKILFPFLSHTTPESLLKALFGVDYNDTTIKKEVKFINEVEGYTHSYDNYKMQFVEPDYYGKLVTDFEFYTQLMERYRYRSSVEELFAPYKDHAIIGVHIRAGNGETGDFHDYRQLGKGNLDGWLSNFINLLKKYVFRNSKLIHGKKPAIFVATDTASVVDYFQQQFQQEYSWFQDSAVPIIVTPQHYPTEGEGVSYNGYHANLTICLDSWKYQMMDMVGLAEYSDVLIAGQYSSFTQSLPLSRILDHHQRQRFFCDVDSSAHGLKCHYSPMGIKYWFNSESARFDGDWDAIEEKGSFAGPQIFLPTDLELSSLKQLIARGGPKKGPKK